VGKQHRLTIHDIARRANVSAATVSRVLHGNNQVDEQLTARVRKVLQESGYIPRSLVRPVFSTTARTIVLLCELPLPPSDYKSGEPADLASLAGPEGSFEGYMQEGYISELVTGINDVLLNQNYHLKLINTPNWLHSGTPEQVTNWMRTTLQLEEISGFILLNPAHIDTLLDALVESRQPCIMLGHSSFYKKIPQIDVDSIEGTRLVTLHLLSQKHTKIAFLSPDLDLRVINERRTGFCEAFAQRGIPLPEQWWLRTSTAPSNLPTFSYIHARNRIEEALSTGFPFTALVCYNDEMAFGAIQALTAQGWQVPAQVSVVGFDDLAFSQMYSPPLTTIRQHVPRIGQHAARLLLRKIRGEHIPDLTILPIELVVRQSTRPLNEDT
jgi:DNA-binding LacI/PurR family transcriptional regulator